LSIIEAYINRSGKPSALSRCSVILIPQTPLCPNCVPDVF
jgi:hypothetical protein